MTDIWIVREYDATHNYIARIFKYEKNADRYIKMKNDLNTQSIPFHRIKEEAYIDDEEEENMYDW